jgi:hypothetical protein
MEGPALCSVLQNVDDPAVVPPGAQKMVVR